MRPERTREKPTARRVGVWCVGARGAISTCLVHGLAGLREGLLEPLGIATEAEPLARLPLVGLGDLVLGGHDVCTRAVRTGAEELAAQGVLSPELLAAAARDAAEYETRLRPGVLDQADVGLADLDPSAARLGALPPREQIDALVADLAAFRSAHGLARVVVVNLASTEAQRAPRPEWQDLAAFRRALDRGEAQPASVVYAAAALESGAPYVNFTPSLGASIPALRELARARNVPHAGSDGKTGETLVKTALAPLFRARALQVLAWQGYNMLGNRDGAVLADPAHKEAKVRNKDEALRTLLGDEAVHTHVGIDYVPSLQDWKTAWDFIHFRGFLGVRMSLQFTWSGSDSALAAPLVLDLVRLADLAAERGEGGEMLHTAAYFKAPVGGGTHDFHAQVEALHAYARAAAVPAGGSAERDSRIQAQRTQE
ncbi:MAG: inositol-3-phosphate synthase [Planctomycetes bacterium]|nr:inositol-3-phosphate synthase [Planctomycetota bacterium]